MTHIAVDKRLVEETAFVPDGCRGRIPRRRKRERHAAATNCRVMVMLFYCCILQLLCADQTWVASAFTMMPASRLSSGSLPLFALRKRQTARRGADIEQEDVNDDSDTSASIPEATTLRSNRNEVDYCIAPADVSLSRTATDSLTRTLNNASNRVVRRILLSLSWPGDADSFNRRLRSGNDKQKKQPKQQPSRSETTYVADQRAAFRDRYGHLPGFSYADDYLACILALAVGNRTEDSVLVQRVTADGVYDQALVRVRSVLTSAGVQFVRNDSQERQIAPQLVDQDICWSVLDKLQLRKEAAREKEEDSKKIVGEEDGLNDAKTPFNGEGSVKTPNGGTTKRRLFRFGKDQTMAQGILLSSVEPTMTRQLNVVSNIVQRALLFGGDEELLFLITILQEDRPAFIARWYTTTESGSDTPGLDYLDALLALLQACYDNRRVETLEPLVPLPNGAFANAYERLVATAVEAGSGYLLPSDSFGGEIFFDGEQLGRFVQWESELRQNLTKPTTTMESFPDDMVGTWLVEETVVGGDTIGTCTLALQPDGRVQVVTSNSNANTTTTAVGRQWRLDPGPTHLDTCQMEVLTGDGNILLYRGFVDRGARWEARISKRPLQVRGSVVLARMRQKKQLTARGTTKFIMRKQQEKS